MSLRKRLRRLERAGVLPCAACGGHPDETLRFTVITTHEEARTQREGIEYCPSCGRVTGGLIRLRWE